MRLTLQIKLLYDFYNNEIFYPFVDGIKKLKYSEWYESSELTSNMRIVV